jgi:site-specific DNA-methyltransferase (adenine-specific)
VSDDLTYPDDFIDKIICGDCLDVVKELPDKSIPLIIADPPYNIGKAAWDKIPDYLNWCGSWIKAVERVMTDNGSLYIFHNDMPVIARLMAWIEDNTDLVFKQMITWCKITPENGFAQQRLSNGAMRNYYNGFTEYILFYAFDDPTGAEQLSETYSRLNPMAKYLREEIERSGVMHKKITALFPSATGGMTGCLFNWLNGLNFPTEAQYEKIREYLNAREYKYLRREYEDLRREYEDLRRTFNPTWVISDLFGNSNTWFYPSSTSADHPTQKPIDLIVNIILHSSNEGDLILDPFAGGGTTAITAIKTDRHYIGIEQEQKYVDIANERIRQERSQLKLDLIGGDK